MCWQVGFPDSYAVLQITLTPVKLSVSEIDYFRYSWNEILHQSLMSLFPQSAYILLGKTLSLVFMLCKAVVCFYC